MQLSDRNVGADGTIYAVLNLRTTGISLGRTTVQLRDNATTYADINHLIITPSLSQRTHD